MSIYTLETKDYDSREVEIATTDFEAMAKLTEQKVSQMDGYYERTLVIKVWDNNVLTSEYEYYTQPRGLCHKNGMPDARIKAVIEPIAKRLAKLARIKELKAQIEEREDELDQYKQELKNLED